MTKTKDAVVGEFRRQGIAEAARHVMARQGVDGASMQAIARAAGVAKGTLYLYFKDRDELLDHAANTAFANVLATLRALAAEDRPLPDLLRDLIRTQVAFFDQNQDFLRVYVQVKLRGELHEASRHRRRRPHYLEYLEILTGALARAAARGEIGPVPPDRLALFLAEGVSAILLRRLTDPRHPAEQEVEWIVDLVLHGVQGHPA